jgi:hypothetical protein
MYLILYASTGDVLDSTSSGVNSLELLEEADGVCGIYLSI